MHTAISVPKLPYAWLCLHLYGAVLHAYPEKSPAQAFWPIAELATGFVSITTVTAVTSAH